MKLALIQSSASDALNRIFEVVQTGVTILLDDGSYPKTDGREEALRDVGLCIIVTEPDAKERLDQARGGLAKIESGFHVVIEENVKVNRASSPFMAATEAAQIVMEGLVGRPAVSAPNQPNTDAPFMPFMLDDPPYSNFGTTNGVRQIVVNFTVQTIIQPRNKDPQ